MAMSDSKFVELCIPDSLRLAKHQDAALVNLAIATTLIAYRKAIRDNVWEKNQAADIARAIAGFMESAYVPHISQEEEDWGKLQLEAEEARVMKAAQTELTPSLIEMKAMPVEPMATGDNLVTITSVRKTKDVKNLDQGWGFDYSGAASGTGSVTYVKNVFGEPAFSCEVLDSSGNSIAVKQSESAGGSLRKAFKKAGYKLSAMPRFAEEVDGKSVNGSILDRAEAEAIAPIRED